MAGTTPSPESRCPVGRGPDGTWALRGHAEVEAAARDPRRFSSAASSHLNVPNGMDGDEHRRFRAVIDRHLADDVIRPLEPSIRHIADDAAARLVEGPASGVELVREFGRRVAVRSQCEWLGWPDSLDATLTGWMDDNHAATRSGDRRRTAEVARRFDEIIRGILADKEPDGGAGADPTSRLMADRVEDPAAPGGSRPLTTEEIVSILRNWTAGDLGSIAASIGVVGHYLAARPELQDRMRAWAADETAHAAALDAAIDEILRIDDPFPANRRVTTADVEVGDAVIPSGSRVELDWIAANRDADVFGDPDEFRPEANAAANLVYGTGPHVCPGRLISTIEIRCAIAALLRATGSFRLDGDRPSEREERPAGGWRTVHLVLG